MQQLQHIPWVRFGLYVLAVVAQVASYYVSAADVGGLWAQATEDTAKFLAGLAGMVALGNFSDVTALFGKNKPTLDPPK